MSTSEIERFASDLKSNAALRGEAGTFAAATPETPLEEIVAFAESKGYSFTTGELEATARSAGKVLSDADLGGVSGGEFNLGVSALMGNPMAWLLMIAKSRGQTGG